MKLPAICVPNVFCLGLKQTKNWWFSEGIIFLCYCPLKGLIQ